VLADEVLKDHFFQGLLQSDTAQELAGRVIVDDALSDASASPVQNKVIFAALAKKQDVLMDGRDIGTVVLPDATVKIFLTASPEARAARRWKEYQEKGVNTPYEEVLADVKQRDYQDTHRAAAPLKQAEDAVLLDTSELDFEQSLAAMKKIIAEKVKN
jgi:cytidylate kinase